MFIDGGSTALHLAAKNGNREEIEKLIKAGADINARDNHHDTALHYAAANGHIEAIKKLIELGADIKAENEDAYTALHSAALYGNTKAIEKLVELGADVNTRTSEGGYVALHFAAAVNDIEAIEKLVELGADVNTRNIKHGYTALYFAARNGYTKAMEKLIAHGADINAKNKDDTPALIWAMQQRHVEAAEILIAAGADINAKNTRDGQTALHYAALHNKMGTAEKLIELGADINAKNNYGQTPLYYAAQMGNIEIIEKLITSGANVNAQTNEDETALMFAINRGLIPQKGINLITTLLKAGAKYDKKSLIKIIPEINRIEDALLFCSLDFDHKQQAECINKFKSFVSPPIFSYLLEFIEKDFTLQDRYLKLKILSSEASILPDNELLAIINKCAEQIIPLSLSSNLKSGRIFENFKVIDILPLWENKDSLIALYNIANKSNQFLAKQVKQYMLDNLITNEFLSKVQPEYAVNILDPKKNLRELPADHFLALPVEIRRIIFSSLQDESSRKAISYNLSREAIFNALIKETQTKTSQLVTDSAKEVISDYQTSRQILESREQEKLKQRKI